jgi:hypothetical protein
MTDRLPALTDILTTRNFDTPYGVIPAGTFGMIVSPLNSGGYLVEFSAPWYVVSVPHDLVQPNGQICGRH